jgi:hypothetical protein
MLNKMHNSNNYYNINNKCKMLNHSNLTNNNNYNNNNNKQFITKLYIETTETKLFILNLLYLNN